MGTVDTNLEALFRLIKEGYRFTPERYPNGDLSTPDKLLAFGVSHSSLHMAKTTGEIAAQVERYEHGEEIDAATLKKLTAKMLLNALKLADVLDMTLYELVEGVHKVVKPI